MNCATKLLLEGVLDQSCIHKTCITGRSVCRPAKFEWMYNDQGPRSTGSDPGLGWIQSEYCTTRSLDGVLRVFVDMDLERTTSTSARACYRAAWSEQRQGETWRWWTRSGCDGGRRRGQRYPVHASYSSLNTWPVRLN